MKRLTITLLLPMHEKQIDEIVLAFKRRERYYLNNTSWEIVSVHFFQDDEGAQTVSVLLLDEK